MNKYWQISRTTLQESFAYPISFFLWRFRSFVLFLSLFFFWLAIFQNRQSFLGYQKEQMLTYVVGITFLKALVVTSFSADVAGQIRSGELTRVILAPINFFSYQFFRDLTGKGLTFFLVILEIFFLLSFFGFPFYFPQNVVTYLLFLLILLLAILLFFFLSLSLSVTAFWTDDPWATRWLFGVVFLEFFSGGFFPLDTLPVWLSKIIYLTPFPYLIFFPLKIWLEQVSFNESVEILGITLFWLIVFFVLAKVLWQKGSKNYGAFGG